MGHTETPHAGIFLTHDIALSDRQLLSDAAQVLRRLDCASGRAIRRSRKRAALMADHLGIAVRVQRLPGEAPYLSVRILNRNDKQADDTLARRILSQTVRGMLSHIPVETIDWYDRETLIEPDEFREIFRPDPAESDYRPSQPPHVDFAAAEHLRSMMTVASAPVPAEAPRADAPSVDAPAPVAQRQAPEGALADGSGERRRGLVAGLMRAPRLLWDLCCELDVRLISQITAIVALLVALQNAQVLHDLLAPIMR